MKIIKPSIEVEEIDSNKILLNIEKAGRTCYQSIGGSLSSAKRLIAYLIKHGHESVLEHEKITVKIITDRGVLTEITRHRIASYSVESTRYCSYKEGIEVIEPCFWEEDKKQLGGDLDTRYECWLRTMNFIEQSYKMLIQFGAKPEEARSVLPNSLKTEIIMTMNLRSWRHFLKLRSAKDSHPQIREIVIMILEKFKKKIPIIFDDIIYEKG